MTEKSITRCFMYVYDDGAHMQPDPDGSWVDWDDHLAALGEAEADRDKYRQYFETVESHIRFYEDETRKNLAEKQAAEQSLQTLRLALEAEVERLSELAAKTAEYAEMIVEPHAVGNFISRGLALREAAYHLRQLLDQPSETAGAE